MITIGTIKFDFRVGNEPFANSLNSNWDHFFSASFEKVVDEVLSAYDSDNQVITIDTLPVDMGKIAEEEFEHQFPLRLREVLEEYAKNYLSRGSILSSQTGICRDTVGNSAFKIMCFYLLHGYMPYETDSKYVDLHFLLSMVISESAYHFREFLNSYGHYDFVCQRLIYNYSDEEIERIVDVVQPSESKFINLYVRVQIRSYETLERPDIAKEDYRNVVWILVLAYLFTESSTYYNRKQMMVHTLRGISAHFNFAFSKMTGLLTESIQHLEQTIGLLPELWSLLKEIRRDVQTENWQLDGDYRGQLMKEILHALYFRRKKEMEFALSYQHLSIVLSDPVSCRKLLRELKEEQIHELVGIIIPSEKDYILSYSRLLDHHKEIGTFTGKVGGDFRSLKWEFIFAVLLSMPVSAFVRKAFVLGVLQRLAAHYNLSMIELLRLLSEDMVLKQHYLPSAIVDILQELDSEWNTKKEGKVLENLSVEDWQALLSSSEVVRKFISSHTERQIEAMITRLQPAHSEFIIHYAALLEKGYDAGLLQGKAGGEFHSLKWEFILSCFIYNKNVAFHQNVMVFTVLKQLAAHYNQDVSELIRYFLYELTVVMDELPFKGLKLILKELYDQQMLPLKNIDVIRSKSAKELEQWAIYLFGENTPVAGVMDSYRMKWLIYFLDERNEQFRILWKSGQLNVRLIQGLVGSTPALRNLWLRRIGDERLLTAYRDWLAVYSALRVHYKELDFLIPIGEFLTIWMVELTTPAYLSWSETEIFQFLISRIRKNLPPGFTALLNKVSLDKVKNITEIINRINELKNEENMTDMNDNQGGIELENAGIVLMGPFFPMLFYRVGYLSDDRKSFKDEASQIRAIFLLQYLMTGEQREWSETSLFLNKIIVGMDTNTPIPRKLVLYETEINMVSELLQSVMHMWDKMRNTSVQGFCHSFLIRKGLYEPNEVRHMSLVKVENRAFDILLDSLPWNFHYVVAPWMKIRLEVEWRTRV